jgi:trehalose 6-phosphate phosphatase
MMDIRSFIGLDSLIYAGSHGFRISGPDGLYMTQEKAVDLLPGLDRMEKELVNSLEKEIPGVSIERKHFAIAIHYRNAPPGSSVTVNEYADRLIARNRDFKKGRGKKIVEIKPSLDWHKGKAVEWIMERLGLSFPDEYLPMYIGDDITDEDAFRTLADNGIGILVGSHSQLSAARYHLRDVDEVGKFLDYLVSSPVI